MLGAGHKEKKKKKTGKTTKKSHTSNERTNIQEKTLLISVHRGRLKVIWAQCTVYGPSILSTNTTTATEHIFAAILRSCFFSRSFFCFCFNEIIQLAIRCNSIEFRVIFSHLNILAVFDRINKQLP